MTTLTLTQRRFLPVVVALAVTLAAVVAVARVDTPQAEAQTSQACVEASNFQHIVTGRAEWSFFFATAVGSGDFLGLVFSTTTLVQQSPGVWAMVDSCPPPSGTTTTSQPGGTTTTRPGGERPPLTQQYTGMYETDTRLPGHTVYRPNNLNAVSELMPIVVWGNGACSANGTWFQEFLTPIAAHGVLVIASGSPNGSGSTDSDMLIDAMDWAIAENSRSGSKYFGKLDTSAVSAMGQSCGGIEAIDVSSDPRVASTVLWNSGIFSGGGLGGVTKAALNELHAPVAWLNGGPSDIAYSNAVDDYQRVPSNIPAVLGSYGNVGHTAMFTNATIERHIVGVAADWLDATLFDNAEARAQFVGSNCGLCSGTEWDMQSKNW